MKLIKQSFQFVNQKGFTLKDIYKHIEYCARISYKSQDKITDTSYEKFVNMLESRGHDRPLEFGTVHLKMPEPEFRSLTDILTSSRTYNDLWMHYKIVETWEEGYTFYVTTNYRYYKLMWNQMYTLSEYFDKTDDEFENILKNAPHWIIDIIKTTAVMMVKNENYPSLNKIKLIDDIVGTCIKEFL